MATTQGGGGGSAGRPMSPAPSQLPPIPASPTYSFASTANPLLSQYNLPIPPPPRPLHAVLTKADREASQAAYADLLTTAKAYRLALASLSGAASAFGGALESCARLKEARAEAIGPPSGTSLSNSFHAGGAGCTADTLMAAAGLHHLVANHEQILSDSVYRAFEVPLLHELDRWRAAMEDEEAGYHKAVKAQSRDIARLEREGLRLHRQQRRRDVAAFRGHLVDLTARLDGLTALHADHARTLLRESQDASGRIVDASCSLVRAEVDIFEGLARKGWTGGGLEDLLEKGADLFAAREDDDYGDDYGDDGEGGGDGRGGGRGRGAAGGRIGGRAGGAGGLASAGSEGSKLFSILPPRSILADSSAASISDSQTLRSGGGGGGGGSVAATTNSGGGGGYHHVRHDSLLVDGGDRYQSLAGAVVQGSPERRGRPADADSVSVFSASEFNRPRGARPFSPQPTPIRLNPDGLIIGSAGEDEDEAGEAATITGPASSGSRERDVSRSGSEIAPDDVGDGGGGPQHHHGVQEDDPWRDAQSGRLPSSTKGDEDDKSSTRPSLDGSQKQRERRWSVTEDDDDDGVE